MDDTDRLRAALIRAHDLATRHDEALMAYGDELERQGHAEAVDAIAALVMDRIDARSRWAADHGVRRDPFGD